MRGSLLKIASVFLLFFSGPAFSQSKTVTVEDAWVRVYEGTVTAYFLVRNDGTESDRLLGVSTPVADRAELLRTRVRSGKFDYQALTNLEVRGFEELRLRPGGVFVRLTGVNRNLAVGETVPLMLRFQRSGSLEVTARVSNQLLGNR